MKITLLEPFFTGSHANWAKSYAEHSQHEVKILSLTGHHWKWRMHGGAVSLAKMYLQANERPDLILATDMLDLSTFLALTRHQTHDIPTAVYFHENQLTYPWSPTDQDVRLRRDQHYSFINYTTALSSDALFFNSHYHQQSFLESLPKFLKSFPDYNELDSIENIVKKSQVLHLGMNLEKFDKHQPSLPNDSKRAIILWNHRWEYDKNPVDFFQALFTLADRGMDFKLVVLGENFPKSPAIFEEAKKRLADKILHFGYVADFKTYAEWLWKADIVPVTSIQDFFGGSVVEAMYCNCKPLLPSRLAYPEHIPELLHPTFFYKDQNDLIKRLQGLLFHVGVLRKQETQQFVKQYRWQKQAPIYDAAFACCSRVFS